MHEFVENTPRVLLGPVKRRPQEHPHSNKSAPGACVLHKPILQEK
jgi:hypothetical protein